MGRKKPEDIKRTKVITMVVQPKMYEDYKKVAHMLCISANELTNTLFKKCVDEHKGLISDYDKLFMRLKEVKQDE